MPTCPAAIRIRPRHPDGTTSRRRVRSIAWLAALACVAARAGDAPREPAGWTLPPAIAAALVQARVPASSFALWAQPVDAAAPSWGVNPDTGVNPASVFKLTTTTAALDLLGPHGAGRRRCTSPARSGAACCTARS